MSIEVVRLARCDWCNEEGTEDNPAHTHRLVFDKVARELELHDPCQEEATLSYLIEKGRKPSPAEIAAVSNTPRIHCPAPGCRKYGNGYMGLAQHMARAHQDIPADERQEMLEVIKESQK